MFGRMLPDIMLKLIFFLTCGLVGVYASLATSGSIIAFIPVMGTFALVTSRLIPYLSLMAYDMMAIARCLPDTKVVHDMLNKKINHLPDGKITLEDFKESIEIRDVCFRYAGAEEDVLRSYDLHANCFITKPIDLNQFAKVVSSIENFWMTIVKLPKPFYNNSGESAE